ncbi:hypothetical protein IJ732_05700, partial [bacterium]|nr:hypothetical protein [bacterium]
VAALAIPTLISNNNKRIVETRLAKFYSNMNQAVELSEVENGSKEKWEVQPYGTNTEEALAWYNKYFGPYLKVTKIITSDNSSTLDIFFPDGSALRMNNIASWHFFPKAETLETTPSYHSLIGKSVFTFKFAPSYSHLPFHYKKGVEPYKDGWNGTEDNLRTASNIGCNENATNEPAFCTELIRRNGWKIPDDYPFKF